MILPYQSNTFGLIYADPPWRFKLYSEKDVSKSPQGQYSCMDLNQIKAMGEEVARVAAPNCALAMWATAPMLPQAFETLKAWGFTYKTCASWAKQSPSGKKWAFGTGYVMRSASEFLLIGTRGKPKPLNRSTRNLFVYPQRGHSRKPDEVATILEKLYEGPYLELFCRTTRSGWEVWGDEVGKFPAMERG